MTNENIILEKFINDHPADAARILERSNIKEILVFLKDISLELAVRLYNHLDRETAAQCLEELDHKKSAAIVEKLDPFFASIFLKRVNKEKQQAILNVASANTPVILGRMLDYPEDSAGALADPLVFTLTEDCTVKEALARVRKHPETSIFYLYIVNRSQRLVGVINMRELMLARSGDQISVVMQSNVVRLSARLLFQDILNHAGWQDFHALPVVDDKDMLLGVIRYKTLRRIERESKKERVPRQNVAASNALGELFRLGFTALMRSTTTQIDNEDGEKK